MDDTLAKAIKTALQREGFKVKAKEDNRGTFWEVVGEQDQKILEYWSIPTGVSIAPSRSDRSNPYLLVWSYVRYVIRAVQSENPVLSDRTVKPQRSSRVLAVVK